LVVGEEGGGEVVEGGDDEKGDGRLDVGWERGDLYLLMMLEGSHGSMIESESIGNFTPSS